MPSGQSGWSCISRHSRPRPGRNLSHRGPLRFAFILFDHNQNMPFIWKGEINKGGGGNIHFCLELTLRLSLGGLIQCCNATNKSVVHRAHDACLPAQTYLWLTPMQVSFAGKPDGVKFRGMEPIIAN